MQRDASLTVVVVLLSVVVAPLAVPGVAGAGDATPGGTEGSGTSDDDRAVATRHLGPVEGGTQTAGPTIDLEQRFDLTPERPGEVVVRLRYRLPDAVTALRTGVPAGATVTGTDGFVPGSEPGTYAWDGRTAAPTLTYRFSPNETLDIGGPIAGRGETLFTDTGDWALLRTPPAPTGWNYRTAGGEVGLAVSRTAVREGAFGETIAYLGPHREVTREGAGQRFRLIVPERAELAASETEVFDSLVDAAERLRVGDRDETVFGVAAPTRSVEWGVRGLQTGDADFWVRDSEPVDSAGNVWVHEYVHTRQAYRPADGARWVTEATATYYAALFTLRQDRTDFEAFRRRLALGESVDSVLADPTTWGTTAPYTRGALVAGELDRQIRLATGGNRTLQAVLRELNARGDVDGAAVTAAVRAASDRSVASRADRLVTTREAVRTWDRAAHREAFEGRASRQVATVTALRVEGPFRTAPAAEPPLLAVGERVTATVRVSNAGTATGPYAVTFHVDGESVATATGRLDPGETTTRTLSWAPAEPGRYELAVADRRTTATVRSPAAPRVESVTVTPTTPAAGRTVTLTARVTNPATVPAVGTLPITVDGRVVARRNVSLAPGATGTVRARARVERAGPHVASVASRQVRFRATEPTTAAPTVTPSPTATPVATASPTATPTAAAGTPPTPSSRRSPGTGTGADASAGTATATADGPGFGPAVAALAVVLAALFARRRG